MKLVKALSLALIAPLAFAIAFATSAANAQDTRQSLAALSALETIKKRGTIVVGVGTFPPWSMRNIKGQYIGFEIDVATQFAKDSGWEIEHVPTAFDGIIPALLAGKFDIMITGMAVTQKRNQQVNFSLPYQWFNTKAVVNKKLTVGMTKWQDLNREGVELVTRRGGFTSDIIKAKLPKATLRFFDDDAAVFNAVINGKAHATFSSEPKPTFYVLQHGEAIHAPFEGSPVVSVPGAFALRKGDPDFLNYVNNWIIRRQHDGWLEERRKYWFASMAWFDEVEQNPFKLK